MTPGCDRARCVCWLTQMKNILVTLVLFPSYTATKVLSRESEAELLHSWKTHLYRTSRTAKKKKAIQCLPSQTSSWSEKPFPLIRKLCQTTFLSLTKEPLSLGLLQFWQLCSAELGCSSQPVTPLSRDTTLSFLNNKTKMNYAQASSYCG